MASETKSTQGLERRLGLFPLTNIVVANMVGAGIFIMSGLLMKDLGNPLVMLALWIAGGAIALCGALSYGELGAAIPHAGGEYIFLSKLYHPIAGFLSGWVSFFVGFSAPIAASAIGFSEYFTRAFPGLLHLGLFGGGSEAVILKKIYASLIVIAFTLIHMRGIEFGSKVQNLLTVLKVGLIVGLVAVAFLSGKGTLSHMFQGESYRFNFGGWKTAGLSLMWIMFAYSGWNASAYIGSEVKNPSRNLPRSLILGTGIVILLYLGLNLFYIYAVPPADMSGVTPIAGLAGGNLFGKSFENILSVLISFALFSSLSAFIILGPRVYYSMAKDKCFFKFVSEVHPVHKVPAKSVLLQGLIAVVFLIFRLDQILTFMGFSLGIFPILAVAGVFKVRRSRMSPYKMPGFPIVPIIYILAAIMILILGFLRSPGPSSGAILTVIVGVPFYFIFKKRYEKGS